MNRKEQLQELWNKRDVSKSVDDFFDKIIKSEEEIRDRIIKEIENLIKLDNSGIFANLKKLGYRDSIQIIKDNFKIEK